MTKPIPPLMSRSPFFTTDLICSAGIIPLPRTEEQDEAFEGGLISLSGFVPPECREVVPGTEEWTSCPRVEVSTLKNAKLCKIGVECVEFM